MFFKQKTAYELRISDWSADVCSSDLTADTKLIWVETPTNPMLKLVDLSAIAAIAHRHHIVAAADNTFASPCLQRPLEHGFDVVMHSATKYISGHSDMVGGMLVVGDNAGLRSEEHTSELQSLMRISYAVF